MKIHHTHSSFSFSLILFIFIFFISSSFSAPNFESPKPKPKRKSASAIFVFGDSLVDPGNNNYIKTIVKSNFPPYGLDFKNNIPTGRFCNGRLVTDFIASYIGVKENVPAYLDPNLGINELVSGVSFASAASGYDPLTPRIGSVISLQQQLEYFREYKKKLEKKIGKQKMEKHIAEALYIVVAASNDFVINYFTIPIRRKTFTIEAYQQFVINNAKQFIQDLSQEGARKIGVTDLPPIGCLPIVITIFSGDPLINRRCVDRFNVVARNYNVFFRKELNIMQKSLAHYGSRILPIDVYNPTDEIIRDPRKFGFEEVRIGCCGSGYLEASILCNPTSFVRPNRSTFVFFDSFHPTEKTYFHVFKSIRPTIDLILSDKPII